MVTLLPPGIGQAQAPAGGPVEVCLSANQDLSLGARLARTADRLRIGGPLRIVAVGSSSTSGLGVWTAGSTYPEVMRRELAILQPATATVIANSGRLAERIPGTVARFQHEILAQSPDLVIWQLGTNDIAWGGNAEGLHDQILQGVRQLKAGGADVVLMDLQYVPMVLASAHHEAMQSAIAAVARVEGVGLFSRFRLMQRAVAAGLPRDALVAWDGLHNSADGYECVGRALARAIAASASPPARPTKRGRAN